MAGTAAALSLLGLVYTVAAPSFKAQNLEGPKTCDFAQIKVLQKNDEKKIYLKHDNRVFVMDRVATAKGVQNVKRYETRQGDIVYLQLPEKGMLLNNADMRPILNECLDS